MMYCIIKNCTSTWNPSSNIVFHGFPTDQNRRKQWLSNIPLKGKMFKSAKICSLHFKEEHYNPLRPKHLLPDAIPFYSTKSCNQHKGKENGKAHAVEHILHSTANDNDDVRISKPIVTSTFPVHQQSYCEQDLKGDIESMIKVNRVVSSKTAEQDENPLFLEHEPMEAIEQDSDSNTSSIKSETCSMKSGEIEDESCQEEEQEYEQVNGRHVQEKYDEDDDIDDDYKVDGESDSTDSLTCSSTESEEEMAVRPTAMGASTTTAPPATTSRSTSTAPLKYEPTHKLYQILKKTKQLQKTEQRKKKIKVLQNRIRRKCIRIKQLEAKLDLVKNYTKCSEIENILCGNYRKLCIEINKNGVPVNYSDDVIKFAITLNYYSPKAYEYVRKYMSLPNKRMLEQYAATGMYFINLDE